MGREISHALQVDTEEKHHILSLLQHTPPLCVRNYLKMAKASCTTFAAARSQRVLAAYWRERKKKKRSRRRWSVRTLAALPVSFGTFCTSRTWVCADWWWRALWMLHRNSYTQGCAPQPSCSGSSFSGPQRFPCMHCLENFPPQEGVKCKYILKTSWRKHSTVLAPHWSRSFVNRCPGTITKCQREST